MSTRYEKDGIDSAINLQDSQLKLSLDEAIELLRIINQYNPKMKLPLGIKHRITAYLFQGKKSYTTEFGEVKL